MVSFTATTGIVGSETQDASISESVSPSSSMEDAPADPAKPRRGRKPKASVDAVLLKEPEAVPTKRTRRTKKTTLDSEAGESYFDQAEEIAHLLNIKLTSRKWGGSRVAMCGFPLIHLDKYLKVLVQQHRRFVAMCEEFPRKEDFGAKEFERRVSRIITPGTLIDEPFLNAYENNFLLAISAPSPSETNEKDTTIGLAWIDVSTGEFYSKGAPMDSVQDELARINPREVVLPDAFIGTKDHPLMHALMEENCFISYTTKSSVVPTSPSPDSPPLLQSSRRIPLTATEQAAVDLLTTYLNSHLLENMPPLTEPVQDNTGRMQIDAHTIKALEIRETNYEGGTRGTLFSVIKRTVTNGGTRLLSRWLCSPSTSLPEITARQSLVEFFVERPHLVADMTQLLSQIDDTSRLTQKFLVGRGDAGDLAAISRTIRTWSKIPALLVSEKMLEETEKEDFDAREWTSLEALVSRMHALVELSETIDRALSSDAGDVEGLSAENDHDLEDPNESNQLLNWKITSNRWCIQPDFSKILIALHAKFQDLLRDKDTLENRLRKECDAPSLTLRASPGQGMHVHLSRKRDQTKLINDLNFIATYESGSTKCFFHKVCSSFNHFPISQEWSHLGNQIIDMINQLTQAEKDAFDKLRNMINEHAFSLRRNSEVIDELDVALSFAKVAEELKFVKPQMTDDNVYEVVNGRHPSVEIGLLTSGRVFTPNSVQLNSEVRVHVITGPNMAGKSTFLRQTALISILAQIGSFVPADAATIGVVDKLFSRIGAKDDLFRDRSTFMVEMLETADILKRATDKSLVIMDEVGRGTTVNDGLAIAFATVHHLTAVNRCRTLFATHFHELAQMLGHSSNASGSGTYQNIRFYCTDVDETDDGYFAYSYRMRPGVNWDSHGLKVAQLAGLPDAAIDIATETLARLKRDREPRSVQYDIVAPANSHVSYPTLPGAATKTTLAL
ncbi:hypothetical protein AN958_04837 [Leucoagaricus sp. SymC.cos]|nr:hypothetical protein AN958_04837 [Leucoagaricus sp. SymC.cos]